MQFADPDAVKAKTASSIPSLTFGTTKMLGKVTLATYVVPDPTAGAPKTIELCVLGSSK